MPIVEGYSRKSIGKNIKAEVENGKSPKQATAIALDVADKAARKRGRPEKSPKGKKAGK
jgi:hypothetical protein